MYLCNSVCIYICLLVFLTPDHPKGRNLPSSQLCPLTKKSPATIMKTHTIRLITFNTLLNPTEFFTPRATITVTITAISRARRSGYDCSPLPRGGAEGGRERVRGSRGERRGGGRERASWSRGESEGERDGDREGGGAESEGERDREE